MGSEVSAQPGGVWWWQPLCPLYYVEPVGTFTNCWRTQLWRVQAWWHQQRQAKETSCVLKKSCRVEPTVKVFFKQKKARTRAMGKIEFHLKREKKIYIYKYIIYIYIYVCICIYVCIYMNVCLYVCVCVHE